MSQPPVASASEKSFDSLANTLQSSNLMNDEQIDGEQKNKIVANNVDTVTPHSASNQSNMKSTSGNLMRPYSVPNSKASTTPKLTIKSVSSDHDDILENILDATDRRASWQNVRSQKSYVPSLSAICKLLYIFISPYNSI